MIVGYNAPANFEVPNPVPQIMVCPQPYRAPCARAPEDDGSRARCKPGRLTIIGVAADERAGEAALRSPTRGRPAARRSNGCAHARASSPKNAVSANQRALNERSDGLAGAAAMPAEEHLQRRHRFEEEGGWSRPVYSRTKNRPTSRAARARRRR